MIPAMTAPEPVRLVELRVLDGPNLYFTRPAIKLTIDASRWLEVPEERARRLAGHMGMPGTAESANGRTRPGPPGTDRRLRFVARIGAHVTRSIADAARTALAVRARTGSEPGQIVVSYPWRRRSAAEALGREVVGLLDSGLSLRRSFRRQVEEAAQRLEQIEPGSPPSVPTPTIPVIAVTGTNGKTTTVRLLAHIARSAGRSVSYSSTDGVYLNDQLVEKGDYSGFGGAQRAMEQPGVQLAVLEIARGGILLRGIGTSHNDVAVVTNVTADHLGLLGIRTLDQLAEVKATILRITKPDGWDVINADDPRVLAMRRVARGRPWVISLDPDHPGLRAALDEGGRGMTVIDGAMALLTRRHDHRPLVALEDVPVTLAGISSHYTQNAMGAAAAALGVGLPPSAVIEGLKTFVLDARRNPGRTNLYEVTGRIVVVDYAHNEAGMIGLVEACQGLRRPGKEIWIAACSAGDRTDQIRHNFAYLAARGSDHFLIAELLNYLRGNTREGVLEGMRSGARDAGIEHAPAYVDEVTALRAMLEQSRRGDVVAVTALSQRTEIFDMLQGLGAREIGPRRVRQLVRQARGAA
jgi:cyanophycin synthetase